MTYTVSGGALNSTQSNPIHILQCMRGNALGYRALSSVLSVGMGEPEN